MSKLPAEEELDFCYLLALLPMLKGIPEYSCLPELFSIIGHEKLILLAKYAGGETIKIPTITQLSDSVDALQWFYDICITGKKDSSEIPDNLVSLYKKIVEVYNVREGEESTP